MHDHPSCEQPCHPTCPPDCAGPVAEGLTLAQVLEHFDRHAVRGQLDTGRYRMRYCSLGEGPPLVFLHGLAEDSRAPVVPMVLLSRSFRCIAYDLPAGHKDGA